MRYCGKFRNQTTSVIGPAEPSPRGGHICEVPLYTHSLIPTCANNRLPTVKLCADILIAIMCNRGSCWMFLSMFIGFPMSSFSLAPPLLAAPGLSRGKKSELPVATFFQTLLFWGCWQLQADVGFIVNHLTMTTVSALFLVSLLPEFNSLLNTRTLSIIFCKHILLEVVLNYFRYCKVAGVLCRPTCVCCGVLMFLLVRCSSAFLMAFMSSFFLCWAVRGLHEPCTGTISCVYINKSHPKLLTITRPYKTYTRG